MVGLTIGFCCASFVDGKTQSGQGEILKRLHLYGDIFGQTTISNRSDHDRFQLGKGMEHGGNKHVSRNAADGIEVNVHLKRS